jgi:hypothetical protein
MLTVLDHKIRQVQTGGALAATNPTFPGCHVGTPVALDQESSAPGPVARDRHDVKLI